MDATQLRRVKLQRVREAWDKAPATIRVMAGPYVVPMMEAMEAMAGELDGVCIDLETIAQAMPLEGQANG